MNKEPKFKYQKLIAELLTNGSQLPVFLTPSNMQACCFENSEEGKKNHVPEYMSNSKHMFQDMSKSKANKSLFALSCLATYKLTISYNERNRFEEPLCKTGIPISSFKKVVAVQLYSDNNTKLRV